ncbi:MAG: hemolysin III family protein [Acidimicrobiia bacterium]|nr:hemolysin III family protein [Acidimicrobiia bacterium]
MALAFHPDDLAISRSLPSYRSTAAARPLWRGRIHQAGFVASIPAGAYLVASATTTLARTALALYAVTWTAMFGASACYHLLSRGERSRLWLRRADHSAIFLHIAGGYAPFCLLALPRQVGVPVLAVVAASATAGVALKLTRLSPGRSAGTRLYLPMGWVMAPTLPLLAPALGWRGVSLVVSAGVVYSLGACCLFRKSPDPRPAVFGYHEVWHTCTVVAGILQFAALASLNAG